MNCTTDYAMICGQMRELSDACPRPLPVMANCAALLWQSLEEINWAGFYLLKDRELILGPFQGKPACVRIPVGKGVCGTAAQTLKMQLVPDVHLFPGHIACDSASQSEIVIPLIRNGILYGVMDIDSPVKSRFQNADREGLESLCSLMLQCADWDSGLL